MSLFSRFIPLFFALCLTQAQALTAVDRSFDELVELSEVVLVGTVSDIQGAWGTGAAQQSIFSNITLVDLDVLKGEVTGVSYVLRMSGGEVDNFIESYPGVPQFQRGERYVLFIRGNERDMFPLVGVMQGFFQVKGDAQGRRQVILNNKGHQVTGITSDGRVQSVEKSRALGGGLLLGDFLQLIRARMPVPEDAKMTPPAKAHAP